MKRLWRPNPSIHMKVGSFWLPTLGLSEDVFVETEDGTYIYLGYYHVHSLLEKLGVPLGDYGWASWQHEHWEILGDKVRFHITFGPRTPNPETYEITIDADTVRRTLLQLKCPYWSREKVVLRYCKGCIFSRHWEDFKCLWDSPWLKPLHEMRRYGIENYVGVETWREYDYGSIAAFLSFTISEKYVQRLIAELHTNYDVSKNNETVTFTRYYGLDDLPIKYYIIIKGTRGIIRAEESGECWSYEDWMNLKYYLPSKKNDVLKTFAEICYHTNGHVEPRFHGRWSMARFRDFWSQVRRDE